MAIKLNVNKKVLNKFILKIVIVVFSIFAIIKLVPIVQNFYNGYQINQRLEAEKKQVINADNIDKEFEKIKIKEDDLNTLDKNGVLTTETISKLRSLVEIYNVTTTYQSKFEIVNEYKEIRKAIDDKINEYIKKVKNEISSSITKLSIISDLEKKYLRQYSTL